MSWYRGPMVGLDFETTSVDPETARIVGAAVVVVQAGELSGSTSWVVNPGVPIEPSATEVHGLTDAYVAEYGIPPANTCRQISELLGTFGGRGIPVVVYNAPFDLTVLDRELRRHIGGGLSGIGPVIDPMVLDKLVGLADYFRRTGNPEAGNVDPSWPMRKYRTAGNCCPRCDRKLGRPEDPDSVDCGGTCLGCIGSAS